MRNLVLAGLSGILLVVLFSMDLALPKGQNEDKQLERVIRVETLLKDTLEKITETNARIQEDSVKLHEVLHAQFEVMKQGLFDNVKAFFDTATHNISRAVKEMNSTATERSFSYIDKVESFIDAATKKITATFKIINSTITSPIEGQSVLHQVIVQVRRADVPYSADTGEKRYKYGINEKIVFEDVMLNEGGGYDPNTGHFKAHEAGVYMFTLEYYSIKIMIPFTLFTKVESCQNQCMDDGV